MRSTLVVVVCSVLVNFASAQESTLSVQQIMQKPSIWIGSWPSGHYWSLDGEMLYFDWNPKGASESDSLFSVGRNGRKATQVSPMERRNPRSRFSGWHHGEHIYDKERKRKVDAQGGDLYLFDTESGDVRRLTNTLTTESNPRFTLSGEGILYTAGTNVYRLDLETAEVRQLTDLRAGVEPEEDQKDEQDTLLEAQQTELFQVIRDRKRLRELREEAQERDKKAHPIPSAHYFGQKQLSNLQIDPSERFVTYLLSEVRDTEKRTRGINMVTESGYAEEILSRPKVGSADPAASLYVLDLARDTTFHVNLHQLPGTFDVPAFRRELGAEMDSSSTKRALSASGPIWSAEGEYAVIDVLASDFKDRWIARLDPVSGDLTLLDQQHDDAWVGGPGIGWGDWANPRTGGFLLDNRTFYFQSEATGYSHLYTVDVPTGSTRQLTDGPFEIFVPQLSKDGQSWFFSSSEGSFFERHYYQMDVTGGRRTRLTTLEGNNDVAISPDGQTMAIIRSFTNGPPEVYVQPIKGAPRQITESPTEAWLSYDWRIPEILSFEASDGIRVPAHVFIPEQSNGAGVIFVHGAGYAQNVHRWWSSYFREYMFNNLLTDLGYTVMNVDYRASKGYGRDWRTAIYRHMGGRDLQDQVDASKYLTATYGIDPERVAIYGGSYGGFITLMALFTAPEYFGAGAALRSVTDWTHYNHSYTSAILNTPVEDSLAYARSSPINFADGLEDPLLMPHGLVDMNVQFQDIIRLTQKLIELGKENWELAVYPVEAHGFTEPDSWTDEYRRILKLIEETVGKKER